MWLLCNASAGAALFLYDNEGFKLSARRPFLIDSVGSQAVVMKSSTSKERAPARLVSSRRPVRVRPEKNDGDHWSAAGPNDNANDFVGTVTGIFIPASQSPVLGATGPQGLSSPSHLQAQLTGR